MAPDLWYTCEFSGARFSEGSETLDFSGNHVGPRTNTNVTTVRFVNSQIDVIPSNLFDTFPNLEILQANNVGLKRVGSLGACLRLQELRLGNNSITRLENGVLRPCGGLRHVNFASNQLNHIDDFVFSDAPRLLTINLSANQISRVSISWFREVGYIASVDLSNNKIVELPPYAFRSFGFDLNLNNNLISRIGYGAFAGFGSSSTRSGSLQLNNNQIKRLTSDIFGLDWSHVIRFLVANNGLVAIERNFFNNFVVSPLGTSFYAQGNNCVDADFLRLTREQLRTDEQLEKCYSNF